MSGIEIIVQVLTCIALIGLLGAVGLRLSYTEVKIALKQCRFLAIVLANFIAVPILAVGMVSALGLKRDLGVAMVLLAASPFAPVVPVFARMARADLALAAALTGIFPLLSVLLTPLMAQASLRFIAKTEAMRFDMWSSLTLLLTTIALPLAVGMLVRDNAPKLGRLLLRPMEISSEILGAVSLAFVTVTQFGSIADLGWRSCLAMALLSEISLVLGWQIGGARRSERQVVALGTSNRNIALALLVAIQNFHGTQVVSAVVGNGLLLIALGLLHVAWWRIGRWQQRRT